MDRVATLAEVFRAPPTGADQADTSRVEAVLQLEEHLTDPRVPALYASLIADQAEYDLARIECMKILRLWPPDDEALRLTVGRAMATALASDEELVRQYAAMSMGPYLADPAAFAALSGTLSTDDDLDVRHNALSAIEEAGPAPHTTELLRRMTADPALGTDVTRILVEWGER
jgi:HEAT repeat protein